MLLLDYIFARLRGRMKVPSSFTSLNREALELFYFQQKVTLGTFYFPRLALQFFLVFPFLGAFSSFWALELLSRSSLSSLFFLMEMLMMLSNLFFSFLLLSRSGTTSQQKYSPLSPDIFCNMVQGLEPASPYRSIKSSIKALLSIIRLQILMTLGLSPDFSQPSLCLIRLQSSSTVYEPSGRNSTSILKQSLPRLRQQKICLFQFFLSCPCFSRELVAISRRSFRSDLASGPAGYLSPGSGRTNQKNRNRNYVLIWKIIFQQALTHRQPQYSCSPFPSLPCYYIMQGFSKQYLRKREDSQKIQDAYDADVEGMTKKTLAIEAKQYTEFADKKQAWHFIRRSYTIVALGFVSSALAYPVAVRIVKRVFGLRNFFNIHFAVIPLLLNFNALVLGAAQGVFNYIQVKQNYKLNLTQQYL